MWVFAWPHFNHLASKTLYVTRTGPKFPISQAGSHVCSLRPVCFTDECYERFVSMIENNFSISEFVYFLVSNKRHYPDIDSMPCTILWLTLTESSFTITINSLLIITHPMLLLSTTKYDSRKHHIIHIPVTNNSQITSQPISVHKWSVNINNTTGHNHYLWGTMGSSNAINGLLIQTMLL